MKQPSDAVLAKAERALGALRKELEGAFGWTRLDVELELAADDRSLLARGVVVAPRVAQRVAAALADVVPDDFRIDVRGLAPLRTGEWHELAGEVTPVWQLHPSRKRLLATELLPEDGPVELLAEHQGHHLIRGIDATVGWAGSGLGRQVPAPVIAEARGVALGVVEAARAFLEVPYLLGGATRSGIDCSALVQRAFARGLGVRLPRHSTDQLAATLSTDPLDREMGDLVFAWTAREGPCHVGILVDADTPSVLHASLSRKRVIVDPLERFLDGAERSEIGSLTRVLDYHCSNLGRSTLELVPDERELAAW